jgi:hypothetical protein
VCLPEVIKSFQNYRGVAIIFYLILLHLRMEHGFLLTCEAISHVKWIFCHHYMVRPQTVDGTDRLQLLEVAVRTMHKQLGTAKKGCSSSLGD